ncbi:hypothetical protein RPATATE_1458 [Rickettsia parkeri str. Tate's Hell]|uniref:RPE5 domain protein n=1 Tax=Rickettsia parkeri str. Tate's Hell TaxID=1359189 RepID=A0ABR5DPG6_RICPA|nr:hypothetical protein RPATATE_1458 [Rickettsia parkeri str. Tate's Hell]
MPVLYKEDKNIIRAVAPRRNSHNEHSSQSPYYSTSEACKVLLASTAI